MKEIIKRKLHKEKKEYQAMVERELLRVMKHPGVIKLKYAFQDKNKLYFVMEFCHLGEFVRFMKEYVDYLTDEVRRFYVAEIVNMLEYLHLNGITHRDLKVSMN
jgi:serine/threonine protein kinase